ncbi:poly(U)-specific endoribonuclease homolog [Hermetia illucens]|nr:poly(U)-specific endoribonuclease homolog [Hermetia illucens]
MCFHFDVISKPALLQLSEVYIYGKMQTWNLLIGLLFFITFWGKLQITDTQNVDNQQLSYGSDILPPYRTPSLNTSTQESTSSKRTGLFDTFSNWFRRTTTRAPIILSRATTISTTLQTAVTLASNPRTNEQFNQHKSAEMKPASLSLPIISTTSSWRENLGRNLSISKQSTIKEDFPTLPPPRRATSLPSRIVPSVPVTPSVWNNQSGRLNSQGNPMNPVNRLKGPSLPTAPSSTNREMPVNKESSMNKVTPTVRQNDVRPAGPLLTTDNELILLSEVLLSKDKNNLNKYINMNLQGKTRSYETTDEAPNSLLQIDPKAFEIETVAKMILLFNNYELDSSVNEYVTPLEKREENNFVDALLATSIMREAMHFLQDKGIVTMDPKTHRDLLKTIWFSLYSRGNGRIGSSGFEHVFLSEIKNGTISGLHNALYFNEEEKKGNVNYKGYLKTIDFGNKGSVIKYRFDFNGISKPVNAMFVGISPELELALYTICFELRPDKVCPISLNGSRLNLLTYSFRYRGKRLIGSAFPEI